MNSKKSIEQLNHIAIALQISQTNKKLLTLEETSIFYNLKISQLQRWVKQGVVPCEVKNDIIHFHKELLDAWLLGKIANDNTSSILDKLNHISTKVDKLAFELETKQPIKPKDYSLAFFGVFILLIGILMAS